MVELGKPEYELVLLEACHCTFLGSLSSTSLPTFGRAKAFFFWSNAGKVRLREAGWSYLANSEQLALWLSHSLSFNTLVSFVVIFTV